MAAVLTLAYTQCMARPPPSIEPTLVEQRASSSPATPPTPEQLGGRYTLAREIGTGGMGRVYQALDRETGETVALKVLRAEIAADPGMNERFKNELRLARRITHKNVCRIHDFNRVDGLAYISMEYVEGETLRARLDRAGELPAARAVGYALQICAALSEAHAQGVVHRDLKPENIMITAAGSIKLMDFGIARLIQPDSPVTQTLIGTPSYMAPEQAQGKGVDARADIYALGLILYECLSARRAFSGATPVAVALKQIHDRPEPLRQLVPGIARPLEAVVMRCLEKDPARRFQSTSELERALRVPARSAYSHTVTAAHSPRRRWLWLLLALFALVTALVVLKKRVSHPPVTVSPLPLPAVSTPVATAPANPVPALAARTEPTPADGGQGGAARPSLRTEFQQWRESAEGGDAAAQFQLAKTLIGGPMAIRNDQEARSWMRRAAEQENVEAQFALGVMYERGRGGPRDMTSALSWYQRAAAGGHVGARRAVTRLTERPRWRNWAR